MGLADLAMGIGRNTNSNALTQQVDVLEFAESQWGLRFKLFPVQRVILKAHYGLPLDDIQTFQVSDWRQKSFRTVTEKSYLEMLYNEGRSNIKEVIPGHERREMVLSIGRRSGKTMMASIIAAYETYKLILKGDPQAYFGLPPSNNIQVISVATDKDQAGLLYQEVSGHFRNCRFFKAYTANNTLSYARFQTPEDIKKYGRYADDPTAKATLRVTFRSCIAQGLRGAGNIVVIMDEVAHFTDKGQSSAEAVYNAVTPSTSAFSQKDPTDSRKPIGPGEGRIISISSPLGKQGQFYKLFQIGMKAGAAAENMLCIQAPTWEVNPSVPSSEFEKHYLKDPTVFFTEYGAEFTDRTRGWIERPSDLFECIAKGSTPTTVPPARMPHFIGIDVGLVTDGTAVAIGHINDQQQIVLDLVDQIKAGEGQYAKYERLEFDDVVDWIYQLSRKFYLAHGVFDQWAGIPFEQALAKRGLRQLQSERFTPQLGSEVFRNFKDMMWDKRIVLYDWPIEAGHEHCGYIEELLELQAEFHSKYITEVHAPNVDGKHDDLSDALTRMVWLASQHVGKPKFIGGTSKNAVAGRSLLDQTRDLRRAMKKSYRSGSSADRQPSRFNRHQIRGRGV
jgi:hypothetical protein